MSPSPSLPNQIVHPLINYHSYLNFYFLLNPFGWLRERERGWQLTNIGNRWGAFLPFLLLSRLPNTFVR
jgi:hypothetical protein